MTSVEHESFAQSQDAASVLPLRPVGMELLGSGLPQRWPHELTLVWNPVPHSDRHRNGSVDEARMNFLLGKCQVDYLYNLALTQISKQLLYYLMNYLIDHH